jgi:hypothetical protein
VCVRVEKLQQNIILRTCALIPPVPSILDRLSCCNETVQNAPKLEFWVEWSGLGVFVLKNSNTNSFSELVR